MQNEEDIIKLPIVSQALEKQLYFFFGVASFLLSFTILRQMGFGRSVELVFFALLFIIFISIALRRELLVNWAILPLGYIVCFLTPLTLLNVYDNFYGSNLQTLVALYLATICGYITSHLSFEKLQVLAYGIGSAGLVIAWWTVTNISDFDSLIRVSLLSENPNQLALYSITGIMVVNLLIENTIARLVLSLGLLICGVVAFSDAFFLALLLGLAVYFLAQSVLSMKFLIFGVPILLISALITTILVTSFVDFNLMSVILDFWREADQGNTRTNLYKNGFIAFTYSPFVGHGAGAFSGVQLPFSAFEAHNTPIDFGTMGGIFLVLIFYAPFLLSFFKFLHLDPIKSAVILAFIAFTMFHFIGRHPLVWIGWAICLKFSIDRVDIPSHKLLS
ncbi:hypothetical protein OAC68_04340 [Gammaproteobacteria bacterium]|nr:hypothetical protein [Gammaproteobacteria bacterium]